MGRIISSDVTTAITARCRAAGEGVVHRGEKTDRQTDAELDRGQEDWIRTFCCKLFSSLGFRGASSVGIWMIGLPFWSGLKYIMDCHEIVQRLHGPQRILMILILWLFLWCQDEVDICRKYQLSYCIKFDTDIHVLRGNCNSIAEPFIFDLVPSLDQFLLCFLFIVLIRKCSYHSKKTY